MSLNVLQTCGAGKRYRLSWALRECSLAVPAGHVAGLVGPNGAGKTTLLHLAVGLSAATEGEVRVLDGLRPGSPAALAGIGFVAQDAPLYRGLSVADMLHLARNLNQQWDAGRARARVESLGLPANKKVGALSGGQQAQLALTIALAKRPKLLILDEPLARLDPLARHEFMGVLMAAVAEDGLSVIFSSHVVAELERIADYLIVLNGGRLQVSGEVEALLASHRVLTGPADLAVAAAAGLNLVRASVAGVQAHLLCRMAGAQDPVPSGFSAQPVTLEELVLAYLREPAAAALPGPAAAAVAART
jgi:ABC-2 type transport system ATP-binding protein